MSEQTPLLPSQEPVNGTVHAENTEHSEEQVVASKGLSERQQRIRQFVTGPLLLALLVAMILLLFLHGDNLHDRWLLRGDPHTAAKRVLKRWPVIDGHIDLPLLYRYSVANNISAMDLRGPSEGHLDIPRLRKGHVGGFWWSAYIGCPQDDQEDLMGPGSPDGPAGGNGTRGDFIDANWRVRDTLEQIDVARLAIEQYPEAFQLVVDANGAKEAMRDGKVASFIGIEGAHQLGNSFGVLRQYVNLGVRYVTLTHTCHNAFADSGGFLIPLPPRHFGLSELGKELVAEMNRLGVVVDLSHTSDLTAIQALSVSRAPVMWSHSSARAVWDVPRNVPNDVLSRLGTTKDKRDGVVMVNFLPFFLAADGKATVETVADHVEMIAKVAGKKHVGIGSDFDGIETTPIGLEDVSKYPNLFAELIKRGWSPSDLAGLAGGNFLRILEGVERVARQMKAEEAKPSMVLYSKRPDFPMEGWLRDL